MSAHPTVSGEVESSPNESICLGRGQVSLVTSHATPVVSRRNEKFLGAVGLTVIIAILVLGAYLGMKYLF